MVPNQRPGVVLLGGCPEMGILKRNGKRTSASTVKNGTTMTWKGTDDKMKLQSMKHINEVSRNGKLEFKLQISIIQPFHVVRLQRELRRCVTSMKHFVRMIQGWFHILNQSSRRLRHQQCDPSHQSSILMRNSKDWCTSAASTTTCSRATSCYSRFGSSTRSYTDDSESSTSSLQ